MECRIHCCHKFLFLLPDNRLYTVKNMYIYMYACMYVLCMYVYIYICRHIHIQIWLYIDYIWITVATKYYICTQIWRGAKCCLDIYHWGAGLAVIGQIRNIGQNVLRSVFQTGSGSSPCYFQIFSLIAFLEEAFIRNLMIILGINDEKLRRYKSKLATTCNKNEQQ